MLMTGRFLRTTLAVLSVATLCLSLSAMSARAAEHLYITNTGSFNISGFTINVDGSLTAVPGSPFSVGSFPGISMLDSKNRFLYTPAGSPTSVWGFHINTDGSLTPVPGSPFLAPTQATGKGVAVSEHGGDFLYLTNVNNTISVYSISLVDGSLTLLPTLTVPTGNSPGYTTVDPTGRFLCVAILNPDNSNGIEVYRIHRQSGALKLIHSSPFASGMGAADLVIDPSGEFLYATNFTDNDVSGFIVPGSGRLVPIASSPFATEPNPLVVTVDPTDRFVYVGNGALPGSVPIGISAFTLNLTNGVLTQLPGSPFPSPSPTVGDVHGMAVDPSGQFLYVSLFTESNANIAGYTINGDGSLTPLSGSPFIQAGIAPSGVNVTPF
jgi:6-phosphogluconolactonase (cycloisomerase 2 family)